MLMWDGMRVGNRPSMSFTFSHSVQKQSKGDLVFMRFECRMNQKREKRWWLFPSENSDGMGYFMMR